MSLYLGQFAQNTYTSCSANRSPHVIAWGCNDLVYYGSCNAVVVYDFYNHKVVHTCCAHKDEVRSVRWIKDCGGSSQPCLVSTSSDATAIIWNVSCNSGLVVRATLQGHTGPVTIADGYQQIKESGQIETIIATSSVDMTVKIWRNVDDSSDITCIQTLKAGSGFCLDIRLHILPATSIPLLACAQDDFKIGLFVWENESFQKKEGLSGHEDWVCCLDWTTLDNGDALLASGSQDTYIRLWRVSPTDNSDPHKLVSQLTPDEEIKLEQKIFRVQDKCFAYKVESILLGHAAWVHSVAWHPRTKHTSSGSEYRQPLQLLSSAMDASVCVWETDPSSGIWSPSARLGLIREDSLGIQGCIWRPLATSRLPSPMESSSILAYTIQGSLHIWNKVEDKWKSGFTVGGGHFGEVMDLCWEPEGAFLITVSSDQTSRIHAPWRRIGQQPEEVWHELARPQVHGYDLTSVACISRYRFASGAEEKIIRCFQASKQFQLCLKHISKVDVHDEELECAQSASVPVLGLSNLSVSDVDQVEGALLLHGLEDASEPLREEVLWRSTLWPEERKLYGHGYEIFCLAASHKGHLLASASRANLPEHAAIILWDTKTWQEIQKLPSHQLTVTQMAFSPNDEYLLSVSRDRRVSVFSRVPDSKDGVEQFVLLFCTDKHNGIHTRIIWTCSWASDSMFFATGSREGTVVIWRIANGNVTPASQHLTLLQSVTALAFAPGTPYVLAVGMNDGSIALYEWNSASECPWLCRCLLNNQAAHHKTVKRLAFRPNTGRGTLDLASCSSDRAVKIYTITALPS